MKKPGLATIGWVFAILSLSLSLASASITAPILVLTRASTAAGPSHEVLSLDAVFPHGGLVQASFKLWILVRSLEAGGAFALYGVPGTVSEGADGLLDDGLQGEDVPALLSAGEQSADGQVLFLGYSRIDVRLPVSLPAGPAEAQIFLFNTGDLVLSNPVPFDVTGATP